MKISQTVLGLLRISMGWLMLWAFIDKLFGLGMGTALEKAWLNGGSPTSGFLSNVDGPFSAMFNAMAGVAIFDWLFMLGLCLIGLALILGVGVRVAGYSGALMMLLMYMGSLPLSHNPIVDDHVINFFVFLYLASSGAGQYLGFGSWWKKSSLVKTHSWLE